MYIYFRLTENTEKTNFRNDILHYIRYILYAFLLQLALFAVGGNFMCMHIHLNITNMDISDKQETDYQQMVYRSIKEIYIHTSVLLVDTK